MMSNPQVAESTVKAKLPPRTHSWHRFMSSKAFAFVAAAVIGAALIVEVGKAGAVPQILLGRDLIYLLEGGWKWKCGLPPQTAYYSPVGGLVFLLVGLGINMGGMVKALPFATCAFAIVLLPMALYVCFRRLQLLVAFFSVVVIMATALTPHWPYFGSDMWGYGAVQIRWTNALFCLVLLTTVILPPASDRTRRSEALDGAIAGVSAAALIFLTMAAGWLAAAMVVVFGVYHKRGWPYAAAAAGGAVGAGSAIGGLLGWDPAGIIRVIALEAHAWQTKETGELLHWTGQLVPDFGVLALLAGLWCVSGSWSERRSPLALILEAGLVVGTLAITALVISMSTPAPGNLRENPILCLGALVFLSGIVSDLAIDGIAPTPSPDQRRLVLIVASVLLSLIMVGPVTARDLLSITQATIWQGGARTLPPRQVFQNGPLHGLQIRYFGGDPPLPASYVGKVMDGLALLARTDYFDETVTCLDFCNPFNIVRDLKPSAAVPIAGPGGFVYSPKAAPPPEVVLNGKDIVLLPKKSGAGRAHPDSEWRLRSLQDQYQNYLDAHYLRVGESEQWQLFVPRKRD